MKFSTHIFVLYGLIALLLIMSTQRHARLNESVLMMKEFQAKSGETRLYLLTELDELGNRLSLLEHKNGIPHVRTVRPHDATGNRGTRR